MIKFRPMLIISLILLILVAAITLVSCKGKEVIETVPETSAKVTMPETKAPIIIEDETEATKKDEVPDQRVEVDGKIQSYLTGEMKDIAIANRRPLAIMMSNDKEALPQYGINDADIVYEAPVEGSMNRFMSIIEDYDNLDKIGSVRSCRTYYTYFAREWDAIYAHYGQSTFAKPYLKNVDNINGLDAIGGVAYYRSSDKKAPHNAYSSGQRIKNAIATLGYSNEFDKDYTGHFKFNKPDSNIQLENSIGAYKLLPGYPYNKPMFDYRESDGLYYRYQYGTEHMGNKGQIAIKNIIFQYEPIGYYATTAYLNINVQQESYGYYFTNGTGISVTVKKDGEFGVTHYYDSTGNEITLNCGKTWICIINTAKFNDTEIYDKDGNKTNN